MNIENNIPIPESSKQRRGRRPKTMQQERTLEPVHEMRAFESYNLEDATKVDDTPWVRPTSLEAPPARPGFVQRWIRVALRGEADPTNASRKFREGWKPRPADTVDATYQVPTIAHGKWFGAIGVEGMVLCEMPKPMWEKRRRFFENKTNEITRSIEAELQAQSRPGMEIYQDRRSVNVREVKVQKDE